MPPQERESLIAYHDRLVERSGADDITQAEYDAMLEEIATLEFFLVYGE